MCSSALLFAGCAKKDPPAMERPPAPVSVVAAVTKDVPVYLDEVGRCVAREVVSVQPEVSGRITEIHFTDGADLKKGRPAFYDRPAAFPGAARRCRGKPGAVQSGAGFRQDSVCPRRRTWSSRKPSPRQDYDTRKNAVDVGEAQVKQNEAAVESARLNLEYTSIRSPIDGRAGHRLVDVGNVVTANTSTLLSIERLDPIYADFTVTENDFSDGAAPILRQANPEGRSASAG